MENGSLAMASWSSAGAASEKYSSVRPPTSRVLRAPKLSGCEGEMAMAPFYDRSDAALVGDSLVATIWSCVRAGPLTEGV